MDDLQITATGDIAVLSDEEVQRDICSRVMLAVLWSIDLRLAEERNYEMVPASLRQFAPSQITM